MWEGLQAVQHCSNVAFDKVMNKNYSSNGNKNNCEELNNILSSLGTTV